MPESWNEISAFYRDLVERGMQIRGMLELAEQIEGSRYASGVFGTTSMHDLCVMQTREGAFWEGPYLRISPLFDGTVEFRFIDTRITSRQWHRVVNEGDAFPTLFRFFDQLHWFARSSGSSS